MKSVKLYMIWAFLTTTTGSDLPCILKDERKTPGKCVSIEKCDYVISYLQSGILPTMCPSSSPIKGQKAEMQVCCPVIPRISAEWCEKYKTILREPLSNPNSKNESTSNIKCEAFIGVGRISGGRDAEPREYPHQVALGYGTDVTWRCGGTLVSEEYVLTAGHCAIEDNNSKSGSPKKVLLGDRILSKKESEGRIIMDVAEVIIHPEYKPPLVYNDIALIKLKSKVNLSRNILPACLPQPEYRLDKKNNVIASGWGQIGAMENQSDTLQTVDLKKYNLKNCSQYFKDEANSKSRLPYGIVRSQICAGDSVGIKDTCRGDSGGPIVVNKDEPCVYFVVGITSFGNNFCGYQQPGVYSNVLRYLDFIEKTVWPTEFLQNTDTIKTTSDNMLTFETPQSLILDPTSQPNQTKVHEIKKEPILLISVDPKTTTTTTSKPISKTSGEPYYLNPAENTNVTNKSFYNNDNGTQSTISSSSTETSISISQPTFTTTQATIRNKDPAIFLKITGDFINITGILEGSKFKISHQNTATESNHSNPIIDKFVENALNGNFNKRTINPYK